MGIYFLDLEFTNGNYYLANIVEMALLAKDTGHTFHRYVQLYYSIPGYVQQLTNINDAKLACLSCSFIDAMTAFITFIRTE